MNTIVIMNTSRIMNTVLINNCSDRELNDEDKHNNNNLEYKRQNISESYYNSIWELSPVVRPTTALP